MENLKLKMIDFIMKNRKRNIDYANRGNKTNR